MWGHGLENWVGPQLRVRTGDGDNEGMMVEKKPPNLYIFWRFRLLILIFLNPLAT